jgi:hypothetical protein
MIHEVSTAIATIADGSATVFLGSKLRGSVHAIKYTPGTIATGADLTITGETTGVLILVQANAGTTEVWFYPRAFPNQNTDGAAEADAREDIHVFKERIKVVVAQGGNVLTGSITVYIDTP